MPKNDGAGSQGNGQGRRLAENEANRPPNSSINCCKWCYGKGTYHGNILNILI